MPQDRCGCKQSNRCVSKGPLAQLHSTAVALRHQFQSSPYSPAQPASEFYLRDFSSAPGSVARDRRRPAVQSDFPRRKRLFETLTGRLRSRVRRGNQSQERTGKISPENLLSDTNMSPRLRLPNERTSAPRLPQVLQTNWASISDSLNIEPAIATDGDRWLPER